MVSPNKKVYHFLPLKANFEVKTAFEGAKKYPIEVSILNTYLSTGNLIEGHAETAATMLTENLSSAPKTEPDMIVAGDWNEIAESAAWRRFHRLQRKTRLSFKKGTKGDLLNLTTVPTQNKKSGSTVMDTKALTFSVTKNITQNSRSVIWIPMKKLIENCNISKDKMQILQKEMVDAFPILTRLYFTSK